MLRILFFYRRDKFLTPLKISLFLFLILQSSVGLAKKLIFLGDSLTEGYGVAQEASFPQIIQKKFKEDKSEWQITASGSSGSTSASTLSRLKWINREKPDVVFILMGSNDGLRGLKVEETEKNLSVALDWAAEQKIKIILGQLHVPPNYGKNYDTQFAAIFPKLAKKHKVLLAPFLLNDVAGQAKLNQPDGIHPNEKGHQIIADNIYKFLKKELPRLK
ncbi:arylesterase [Pseudobdellovibrio exovorus]|uniref:Lipase/acylhydrolase domain-containing protein n=1 Tax=Pseudobdellovibrio exovorus JSS TaxID=1184267 RepID=M4VED3_9BACT|nr:arylesterase [Pseudobdellovibrio exovorus]AGH96396.1 lipase/acylhydrolase domain-containing protein [Pseudobdellovibrio exovorus JSS]